MPEADLIVEYALTGVVLLILGALVNTLYKGFRGASAVRKEQQKQEALFKASFPELQPYFHPAKVLEFVRAWRSRSGTRAYELDDPPGLAVAKARFLQAGPKGQPVELLDSAGAVVTRFVMQLNENGGVIRIGPGKLTANVRDAAVRYWHPEREFKWSRVKGWRLISALSDRAIESSDRGTSFSSDSSPSTTTIAASAAGAAVVAGAGGAFDGGGSSASWDEGSRTSY
jgi:hypothetical protein